MTAIQDLLSLCAAGSHWSVLIWLQNCGVQKQGEHHLPPQPTVSLGDFTLQYKLATWIGVGERTPPGGIHHGTPAKGRDSTTRLFPKMSWDACPNTPLPASAPRSPTGSRRENEVSCLLIRPGKPLWVKVAAIMKWGWGKGSQVRSGSPVAGGGVQDHR